MHDQHQDSENSAARPLLALLRTTFDLGGSDLHLTSGERPAVRVNGDIRELEHPPLGHHELLAMFHAVMTARQRQVLEDKRSVDLGYSLAGVARFRVNVFHQRGTLAAVLRRLPSDISSAEVLGLPPAVNSFTGLRDGLVLVTGPTGSGKTTTLAALIDMINRKYPMHIITVEDPIEFLHANAVARVTQRELYTDVPSYPDALRDALREDPDVILVGEMRDLDTIRIAIMAAETGHLVFSTLHSRDAVSTITRMVSVFPSEEQPQISTQLAGVLRGVVSQRLLREPSGCGRSVAVEVMRVTPGIANLVRIQKVEQIYSSIETGASEGMQTMELSLARLCKEGRIDKDTALRMATSESLIRPHLERLHV